MLAFELYERVIAASVAVGILAAHRWARLVNGATPLFGIKEAADRTVDVVLLMAQDPLGLPFVHVNASKALFRLLDAQSKVSRKPRKVTVLDLDSWVATAISGTLGAVVLNAG